MNEDKRSSESSSGSFDPNTDVIGLQGNPQVASPREHKRPANEWSLDAFLGAAETTAAGQRAHGYPTNSRPRSPLRIADTALPSPGDVDASGGVSVPSFADDAVSPRSITGSFEVAWPELAAPLSADQLVARILGGNASLPSVQDGPPPSVLRASLLLPLNPRVELPHIPDLPLRPADTPSPRPLPRSDVSSIPEGLDAERIEPAAQYPGPDQEDTPRASLTVGLPPPPPPPLSSGADTFPADPLTEPLMDTSTHPVRGDIELGVHPWPETATDLTIEAAVQPDIMLPADCHELLSEACPEPVTVDLSPARKATSALRTNPLGPARLSIPPDVRARLEQGLDKAGQDIGNEFLQASGSQAPSAPSSSRDAMEDTQDLIDFVKTLS